MKPEDLSIEKKLIQLAEEAAELAQAAIKVIRASDGDTPVDIKTAWENMLEEIADIEVCVDVLVDIEDSMRILKIYQEKYDRWSERLNGRSEVSEVHTE